MCGQSACRIIRIRTHITAAVQPGREYTSRPRTPDGPNNDDDDDNNHDQTQSVTRAYIPTAITHKRPTGRSPPHVAIVVTSTRAPSTADETWQWTAWQQHHHLHGQEVDQEKTASRRLYGKATPGVRALDKLRELWRPAWSPPVRFAGGASFSEEEEERGAAVVVQVASAAGNAASILRWRCEDGGRAASLKS